MARWVSVVLLVIALAATAFATFIAFPAWREMAAEADEAMKALEALKAEAEAGTLNRWKLDRMVQDHERWIDERNIFAYQVAGSLGAAVVCFAGSFVLFRRSRA